MAHTPEGWVPPAVNAKTQSRWSFVGTMATIIVGMAVACYLLSVVGAA